jgi:hypothetical protein
VNLPAIPLFAAIETSSNQTLASGALVESQSANAEAWSDLVALLGEPFSAAPIPSAPGVPAPNPRLQWSVFSPVLAEIDVSGKPADAGGMAATVLPARVPDSTPSSNPPADDSPVVAVTAVAPPPPPVVAISSFQSVPVERTDARETPLVSSPRPAGKPLRYADALGAPQAAAAIPAAATFDVPLVVQPVPDPVSPATPAIAHAPSEPAPISFPVPAAHASPTLPAAMIELDTPMRSPQSAAPPEAIASLQPEIAFAVRLQSSDPAGGRPVQAIATLPAVQVPAEQRTPVLPVQPAFAVDPGSDQDSPNQRPQSGPGSAEPFRRLPLDRPDAFASDVSNAGAALSPQVMPPHTATMPIHPNPVPVLSPAALPSAPPADPAPIARATSAAPLSPAMEDAAPQPVRELSIRISDGTSRSADVRITDRAGEVRVSVRSADPELNTSLRDGLSGLASQLDRHPVSSEIWHPAVTPSRAAEDRQQNQGDSGGEAQQGHNSQSNSENGGGQTPRRQQQPAPDWEEMEPGFGTFHNRYTRT